MRGERALAVAVLYGAMAMLFPPFTWLQRVATGLPCLAAVAVAVRRGWHRPGSKTATGTEQRGVLGLAVWLLLIGVAVAVQLFNYSDWPRTVYPTLSSLANQVFWLYPVRLAAFVLWLRLGWYVINR